jgi:hypothetical protein
MQKINAAATTRNKIPPTTPPTIAATLLVGEGPTAMMLVFDATVELIGTVLLNVDAICDVVDEIVVDVSNSAEVGSDKRLDVV